MNRSPLSRRQAERAAEHGTSFGRSDRDSSGFESQRPGQVGRMFNEPSAALVRETTAVTGEPRVPRLAMIQSI